MDNIIKQMIIKQIPLSKIKAYHQNSKTHSQEQIDYVSTLIDKYGFTQPLVIDSDNNLIIGHCRLYSAKQLNLKTAPVVVMDNLTEAQIKALRIQDNRASEMGKWDTKSLEAELKELDALDFDISSLSLDNKLINNFDLPLSLAEQEQEKIQDNVPEISKISISKFGDIYQLGNHRIMCGDCTNSDDIKKLMNGKQADMVFTDPPYNVNYYGIAGNIENDNLKELEFREFLAKAYGVIYENIREGAVVYITHPDTKIIFRDEFIKVGFKLSQVLIWNKNQAVFGRQDYNWKHEPIIYGWKEGQPHYFSDDYTNTTVIDINKPVVSILHPTTKPIELIQKLIENSSKHNWTILDTFLGSGSTLIACEKTNRTCYGMEISPFFIDTIIKRYEQYSGNKALKL